MSKWLHYRSHTVMLSSLEVLMTIELHVGQTLQCHVESQINLKLAVHGMSFRETLRKIKIIYKPFDQISSMGKNTIIPKVEYHFLLIDTCICAYIHSCDNFYPRNIFLQYSHRVSQHIWLAKKESECHYVT